MLALPRPGPQRRSQSSAAGSVRSCEPPGQQALTIPRVKRRVSRCERDVAASMWRWMGSSDMGVRNLIPDVRIGITVPAS
jgi:hypothetical protein